MIIEAPYPDIKYILTLPEPEIGNTQNSTVKLTLKRMMDSSIHTYTNKKEKKAFNYTFVLPKLKALEYIEFMRLLIGSTIRIDGTKICQILTNPTELELQHRAVAFGSNEDLSITLTVEEI